MVAAQPELAEKIAAETTPLDDERALVGLEVPDARAAPGSSTPPATRSRSTPCSSSATGPARRRSCADPWPRPARPPPIGLADRPIRLRSAHDPASWADWTCPPRGAGCGRNRPGSPSRRPASASSSGWRPRGAGFSPIEAMAMSVDRLRRRRPVRGGRLRRRRARLAGDRPPDGAPQRPPPALLGGARPVAARPCRRASGRPWPTS